MDKSEYRPAANPEWNAAMQEIGRSSCTEPHKDRRTRKARTRKAARTRAIRDQY